MNIIILKKNINIINTKINIFKLLINIINNRRWKMSAKLIGSCPVCSEEMKVTRLYCNSCGTSLEGDFSICRFCRLDEEQREFLETFIRCKGNIKEVEGELGISYPTVKRRLDQLIEDLGYQSDSLPPEEKQVQRKEILDKLEAGEISSVEAVELLENL
jgi:hypothetical protein